MRRGIHVGGLVLCLAVWAAPAFGQGIVAPGAGPINSAMAGASTAAPIEFGGSYWNPAIISGLSSQEFLLGSASDLAGHQSAVDDPGKFDVLGGFPRRPVREHPGAAAAWARTSRPGFRSGWKTIHR